jgi:hypothetical protein
MRPHLFSATRKTTSDNDSDDPLALTDNEDLLNYLAHALTASAPSIGYRGVHKTSVSRREKETKIQAWKRERRGWKHVVT